MGMNSMSRCFIFHGKSVPHPTQLNEGTATRTQVKEGEVKRWGLFLAMLLSMMVVLSPGVSAAEEVAIRLRPISCHS
jgi:hypothetical protein